MIIRRIRPASVARITGTLYAALGLFIGLVIAAAGLTSSLVTAVDTFRIFGAKGYFPSVLSLTAVVIMPLLYGVLGFVAGYVAAALYNGVAPRVGGIEIEVD
jgi:hypothetical protein